MTLKPLLRSSLSVKSKLELYKTYNRPVITYAAPAWGFISKNNMSRLQVVQKRVLRLIGGYDWNTRTEQLYSDYEIPMMKTYQSFGIENTCFC